MRSTTARAAAIICVLGLAITALVTSRLLSAARAEHRQQVQQATETLRTAVQAELRSIETGLEVLRDALVVAARAEGADDDGRWQVDPRDFTGVAALGVREGDLGVARGLSLVREVAATEIDRYERTTGITVHPPTDQTAYVVEALVPLATNAEALGLDLGSEANRRTAVETGRDTGEASVTAPIDLVQGAEGPAVQMFVPAYDGAGVPRTVATRRQRFVGGVTAIVEPDNLIPDAVVEQLHLQVGLFDVGHATPSGSGIDNTGGQLLAGELLPQAMVEVDLQAGDRRWLLLATPAEGFAPVNLWPSVVVSATGIQLTLVLAALAWLLLTRQARTERLVEARTAELTRSRTELQRANERLRASDAMKTSFLVTVSHELRTPLTTIRGFATLLESRAEELGPEERSAFINQLARSAEGLSDLLHEVLEFAELEQHGARVVCVPFDIGEVVARVAGEQPGTHRITVDGPAPQPVHGDPQAVGRALGNVLANARAYSEAGTRISVWIRPTPDDQGVEVVVDDQGPGIPEDEHEAIFERFHRGASAAASTVPGTGIGLTVARQLLEAMDGGIVAGTAPSGGARFVMTLKCAQISAILADLTGAKS